MVYQRPSRKNAYYCEESFMPERLVDVEKLGSKVLHTFPVTISAPAAEEEAFTEKASEAAGNAKLVPIEELESLNAKMHVSRGGQLTPYGDPHGVLAETKAGLDQVVRERAYLLWEQGGSAGWPRRRLLAPSAASTLLRTRLCAVGAGRLSGRQGGRALVSDARL
jgi:hypothetical protein